VVEEMVVVRRAAAVAGARGGGDAEDAPSLGWKGMDPFRARLNPLLSRVLGQRTAAAAAAAARDEEEVDLRMLASMAEFPGYGPTSETECAYVLKHFGAHGVPPPTPPGRESLPAFITRKLTPRQPPEFAALVAACLGRHPEDRPTAAEALHWPGAWVDEP
jgi:hypothetical protein